MVRDKSLLGVLLQEDLRGISTVSPLDPPSQGTGKKVGLLEHSGDGVSGFVASAAVVGSSALRWEKRRNLPTASQQQAGELELEPGGLVCSSLATTGYRFLPKGKRRESD